MRRSRFNLSCATLDATIRYTTNGSWPSETSGTVGTNVTITTTTPLRAIAYKAGFTPSKVVTHTYIFVNDVVNQPNNAKDIPNSPVENYYADCWFQSWGLTRMKSDVRRGESSGGERRLEWDSSLSLSMDKDEMFPVRQMEPRGRCCRNTGKA